ncbi:Chaperone protein DnaJ [Candidatus Nitrosocosmicus oleophilus]|uniref:Chaperone protein DnaJ n=1 Tax=Candidatus Nitrosocosmicus oleophilus TaxID=1353260 RepID=A0A654LYS0_9ARCH|nr:Chaperone protein DnaJ [Candidatus Nitrosocosmicus oleophilus]
MDPKDYYSVFEFSPNSTDDEIRDTFHICALKYHPDKNKSMFPKRRNKGRYNY